MRRARGLDQQVASRVGYCGHSTFVGLLGPVERSDLRSPYGGARGAHRIHHGDQPAGGGEKTDGDFMVCEDGKGLCRDLHAAEHRDRFHIRQRQVANHVAILVRDADTLAAHAYADTLLLQDDMDAVVSRRRVRRK